MIRAYAILILVLIVVTSSFAQTWTRQTTPVADSIYFNSIKFVDANNGWAVGSWGTVLHTTNGGSTWQVQFTGITATLFDIDAGDASNAFIVGANGVYLSTSNAGSNWFLSYVGTGTWNYCIEYLVNRYGWIGGMGGWLFHTTDGGAIWAEQPSSTTQSIYDVTFVNNNTGWAAGGAGFLRKTINSGTTWLSQNSATTADLHGLWFIDSQNGWVVGNGGTVLRTTNAGTSWSRQSSGTTANLLNVCFTSLNNGWSVSTELVGSTDRGTILRTTNAGANWTTVYTDTTRPFHAVSALTTGDVWVCGASAAILHAVYNTAAPEPALAILPSTLSITASPNPFNATSRIRYTIPASGLITLELYDRTGKLQQTLYHGTRTAGEYRQVLQGDKLTSGTYFIKLTSGSNASTRKVVLIK